ncbi:MAG: hypothetical protein IVW52_05270 [Acidimicrobiales bacterium]|nr:hypothetical protein [Acidimicrobiales bacterium]
MEFAYAHRQSVTTLIGTSSATILGAPPPQQSYEITEVVVAGFGTVGGPVVNGRLMQFATIQGFSPFGTVLGTVVEPFSVTPGDSFIDGNGDAPIAYVDPGNLLYGQVDSGSVLAKIVYRALYQRG